VRSNFNEAGFPLSSMRSPGNEQGEATILLVEANAAAGCELVEQLRADGYRTVLAHGAEHARVLACAQPVRAVLLGTLDGPRGALDLLEDIRRPAFGPSRPGWNEDLPVIVFGSRSGTLDLLRAFEMGSDDFIAGEGQCYLELRARLKALLRRAERPPRTRICVGQLEVDRSAHMVRFAGTPIALRRLEYELLVYLARDPTSVCTKQELLKEIWRLGSSSTRTVDSHASRLRRKLDGAGAHGLVVNVWGVGYRLV
jgi:two-component system response regulator AdeR